MDSVMVHVTDYKLEELSSGHARLGARAFISFLKLSK